MVNSNRQLYCIGPTGVTYIPPKAVGTLVDTQIFRIGSGIMPAIHDLVGQRV